MPRAVLPGVAHHVTQRGVHRETIFFSDADRRVYLKLVGVGAQRQRVELLGYCLMPNHVHWIVVPPAADSLANVFGEAHSRFAHYANAKLDRSGHFWQGRFFSCALEGAHLWAALRYVEQNPIRGGLAESAVDWEWSSAAVHAARRSPPSWLSLEQWRTAFTAAEWLTYLASETMAEADLALRVHTYCGRPVGSAAFIEAAEGILGRSLRRKKGGRPRRKLAPATAEAEMQRMLIAEA